MKKLLPFSFLILLIALISFRTEDKRISQNDETIRTKQDSLPPLPYSILKSFPDSTLKTNESLFAFTFYDENGIAIKNEIKLSYNGIEKTAVCDKNGKANLKVMPGKYIFQFFYNDNHFEIKTDSIQIKPTYRSEVQVIFESTEMRIIADKPVIYVYPTKSQAVNISLNLKGELGFTYPAYKNGWDFIADPDGTIHMNDKKYNYLFWDGTTDIVNSKINWEEGFVVKKENLVPFFEEKLSTMGLNSKEIEDYITYWCPRMNVNENNYVHFIFNEEYAEYASLNITPKPDHLFRVFMLWSKADSTKQIIPQTISTFQREGFTVIEWGGGEMNRLPL